MTTDVTEFVMSHPLFSHHDHHNSPLFFEERRAELGFRDLLGYAEADLVTAAGPQRAGCAEDATGSDRWVATHWPPIRTTGYGRAVNLACRELFGVDYEPENFSRITDALASVIEGKTAAAVYDYFVRKKANNRWVLQDGHFRPGNEAAVESEAYPDYYRFAWRMDDLLSIYDSGPIAVLEQATNQEILSLDDLVRAMNSNIDTFKAGGKLASLKVGIAYQRDLVVGDPTRHEAELVFNRIRSRKFFYDGVQQNTAAAGAREARPLADYLFHSLLKRANDDDLPVQIHTGYLAGNWGSLGGTKALHLIPLFEKYRRVRFDIFHASWPWTSELGAVAKNYPNVYPDLCWAWTMNPSESERALSEWLDGVPYNKIFGYGADTGWPWCNVGYSIQARRGIARVLEEKIAAGHFSRATAREVAAAIMLKNGEAFYGL